MKGLSHGINIYYAVVVCSCIAFLAYAIYKEGEKLFY